MFSSAENSPYGILPEQTIPFIETKYPLFDNIVYGAVVKTKRIEPFQAICHKLMCGPKQIVSEETFVDDSQDPASYIDLDLLGKYKKTRELKLNQPHILKNSLIPDNLIRIDPRHLSEFKKVLRSKTNNIKDTFINDYLPQVIGIDDASAYVEAFVRDGLGLENFSISSDMLPYIHNAIKADFIAMILSGLKNLSPKDRTAFKAGYIQDALATAKYTAKTNIIEEQHKRYQESLDNPAGHVMSTVGIKKSRAVQNEQNR